MGCSGSCLFLLTTTANSLSLDKMTPPLYKEIIMAVDKVKIEEFRNSIKDFTLEELKAEAARLQEEVSKMILDSDLIIKAAIVDSLIKEKEAN